MGITKGKEAKREQRRTKCPRIGGKGKVMELKSYNTGQESMPRISSAL